MWTSALADFSASRLAVKVIGCGSFGCGADVWLTGSFPTYFDDDDIIDVDIDWSFEPFVDEPTDDEDEVDEFEGSGMLVVVVVDGDDEDWDVMIRPFVVDVADDELCWK